MTETTTSKVEKWAYPLKVDGAQATESQQYYAALAKAKDGYYPLGANGLWHGGVHFDETTGLVADLTEVRCIADGEVVAYRIDEAYPKSDYGSTQAVYSTGFVLIKHRLEVPVLPASAPVAGAQPAAATPGPSLTFFSLYMHLLDWEGYKANPALARPPFWGGGSCQVKATADDKILGLRVRKDRRGKPGYTTVLSVLPRGTVVETGEEENGWLKVVSIAPADPNVPSGSGWVFKREMTASATPNSYVIGTDAKDEMNPPRKGLAVHAAANQTSPTTAILPIGTEVRIGNDGARGKYQKLLEIVSGNAIAELTASNGILGYIWEGLLETKSEPATKNTVHLLEQPLLVKAGSVIGHVGKYQNHDDAAPKNLLHLEVFSCEDVKAFMALSKSKASALPTIEKTLVKIPKDTPLITHVQGMNAENPPKVSDPSQKVGYAFVIPLSMLEALPAEKKIKVPVVMAGSTTYTYWWRIDGLLGDAEGNGIDGWFAEPDTALSRHSPFEWEGFEFLEESVSNVDHLAAYLHDLNQLDDTEKETFVPKASASTSGPVKERLYRIIDTDRNDRMTLTEIRAALTKPWFSQPISQLVTKHESEWLYKVDKWDALDELMGHTPEQPNMGWVAEKKRIEHLSWWELAAVGPETIWHINSVAFIGSMNSASKKANITVAMLKNVFSGLKNTSEKDDLLTEIASQLNENGEKYKLDTELRLSHFFAQVRQEIGSTCRVEEDFTYGPEGLKGTFGYFARHPNEAVEYGFTGPRKYVPPQNQMAIANRAYGARLGNGDIASGDGWKYRGRGLKHLTARANYEAFTDYHKAFWGEDIDFIENPDLLHENYKYSVRSGVYFWLNNNLFLEADGGYARENVDAITRIINRNTDSYSERWNNFKRIYEVEKIFSDI